MLYKLITVAAGTPVDRQIREALERAGIDCSMQANLFDQEHEYVVFSADAYYDARRVLYDVLQPQDRDKIAGHPRDTSSGHE